MVFIGWIVDVVDGCGLVLCVCVVVGYYSGYGDGCGLVGWCWLLYVLCY